ncbi:MAG TPA: FAD-dependent monooxygenase [Allosphingosinicella sp.]
MLPNHTEVLIVGAGPTGLAAAVGLSQAGIDHLLIDSLAEGQNSSRAAVVHAHTLEALATLGVADALQGKGVTLSRFAIRDRDRPLLELGFGNLPTAHSGLLMVPQCTTEAVLGDRLVELGGTIHRGVTALEVREAAGGAEVRVGTADGEQTIRARYVVAGDGMHSLVREAAGIAFEGEAYAESFILADVRTDWPLGAVEVSLFFSPDGMLVVAPLPGGAFRIVATMEDAPRVPGVADIQRLLETRGPAGAGTVHEVIWGSRFRVQHRLAERFRRGPFLLMGDAAHVHSPAGGQGMNTGLVDAVLLSQALAKVVRGEAPDGLLDLYAELRRPAAEQVLHLAGRLTKMAMLRSPMARFGRNLLLRILNRFGRFRRMMAMNLSGLGRRALAELGGPPCAPPAAGKTLSRRSAAPARRAMPARAAQARSGSGNGVEPVSFSKGRRSNRESSHVAG